MSNIITIKYEKWDFKKNEYEHKIENLHHCFLEGGSEDKNITEYLGIWTTDSSIKICKIEKNNTITIESWDSKGIYTYGDIKEFLSKHNRVQNISEQTFMDELNRILAKIK